MDARSGPAPSLALSSFHTSEWRPCARDTHPHAFEWQDLSRLRSLNDPISLEEVVAIYLPLSRLLALYVAATQGLYQATQRLPRRAKAQGPLYIGVAAGSVAAAKSTLFARQQALLSSWPNTRKSNSSPRWISVSRTRFLESEGIFGHKGQKAVVNNAARSFVPKSLSLSRIAFGYRNPSVVTSS